MGAGVSAVPRTTVATDDARASEKPTRTRPLRQGERKRSLTRAGDSRPSPRAEVGGATIDALAAAKARAGSACAVELVFVQCAARRRPDWRR
jgi:hypothetical protein